MQPNNSLTAHKLAEILLNGEDYPVAIPSTNNISEAHFIQYIDLFQHADSPFEYCLLLTSKNSNVPSNELEILD